MGRYGEMKMEKMAKEEMKMIGSTWDEDKDGSDKEWDENGEDGRGGDEGSVVKSIEPGEDGTSRKRWREQVLGFSEVNKTWRGLYEKKMKVEGNNLEWSQEDLARRWDENEMKTKGRLW